MRTTVRTEEGKLMPELGLVHASGASGGICLDDAPSITAYTKAFTHLTRYTLSRGNSQTKFLTLAKR